MKGKRYLLAGMFFGTVMGWALGFLRLPYIEKDFSFLLGCIAALAFASLVLLLLAAWNRNYLPELMGKKNAAGDPRSARALAFIWKILIGILLVGSVAGGWALYRQRESFQRQIEIRDKRIQEMAALMKSVRENDLAPLMRNILDDVWEELKHNPRRTLSDTTITRIAAISFSFKPYPYIEADSLSEKAYSPERGHLLQALILMNIDSGSFAQIKRHTLFAGADLRGANLKALDLSGIHLRGAYLKDADLSGANLKGADLGEANLWGANLNRANLSHADLKRADLSWAQLNEATLILANLSVANLANAQLNRADLNQVTFQAAQSGGALFHEANFTKANLVGANFTKANLSQAILEDTELRRINFSGANLLGVRFNKAIVDKSWLDKLKEWQPIGKKEVLDNYTIVNDTIDKWKVPLCRLKKM